MITRKIGKILRGKATPMQLMLACILGSMIGFVPSFATGPGLTIALLLLLLVLNANIGLALLTAIVAKLLSLLLMPVSFAIGRVLLDGPTEGLFRPMINAPVLALFGFEYYATSGGMVLGLIVGIVLGLTVISGVQRFRGRMAQLESGSERYQKFAQKKSVKALTWIFFGGGHGKLTYQDLLERKRGLPIRIPGVIVAAVLVIGVFVLLQVARGPILTGALKRGLEQANGATVDINAANIDLGEGRLTVTGLAMADPNALDRDLLNAATVEADIAASDLLRKRVRLDRVVISEALTGTLRVTPGKLVARPPSPLPDVGDVIGKLPEEGSIEDYIAYAEQWKRRLAQVRQWIEKIAGGADAEDDESLNDWLARRIEESGYARVKALHLIEDAPTFTISELVAEGVRAERLEGEIFDVNGQHLSTHPHLLNETPRITVSSRSGRIGGELALGDRTGGANAIAFTYKELAVDDVAGAISVGGVKPIEGGEIDLELAGSWSRHGVGFIDLPLSVTLRNTTLQVPGAGSQHVDQFVLPIGLRGPIDDPRIRVDDDILADALMQAGANELAGKLQEEADELIGDLGDKVGEELGDQVGEQIGGALKGLLGGDKKDDSE